MRVLVIEDDKQTRDFIVQGLNESGHVADKADNGKDGLFMALEHPYDTIVVDRRLLSSRAVPFGFTGRVTIDEGGRCGSFAGAVHTRRRPARRRRSLFVARPGVLSPAVAGLLAVRLTVTVE